MRRKQGPLGRPTAHAFSRCGTPYSRQQQPLRLLDHVLDVDEESARCRRRLCAIAGTLGGACWGYFTTDDVCPDAAWDRYVRRRILNSAAAYDARRTARCGGWARADKHPVQQRISKSPIRLNHRSCIPRWAWLVFTRGGIAALVVTLALDRWAPVPVPLAIAIFVWAGTAMFSWCFVAKERARVRRVGRTQGFDVCTACWSTRALQPDDQHCPECGAPRACSGCKHRIEANQCACPECGRAVWGRAVNE